MTENFLRRWSRLKREPPAPAAESPAAPRTSGAVAPGAAANQPLPDPESLEFSSDFTAFMGDEVADGVRRLALQRLFHAEHFNVMDGLDVYVEDYNSFEPVGEELLRNLNQARGLIFDEEKSPSASGEADPVEGETPGVELVPSGEATASRDTDVDKQP